ncbi:hypothetical protein BASA81_002760 [Batrachochytrium salamandrivorans]|nr:hypothetical protein BASA81_002760 [Batrachochytrium salamandrivorans]
MSSYEQLRNTRLQVNLAKMVELGLMPEHEAEKGEEKQEKKRKEEKLISRAPEQKRLFSQLSGVGHPCNQQVDLPDPKVDNALGSRAISQCLEVGFPTYLSTLQAGHSVLLRGLGSKAFVLNRFVDFARQHAALTDYYVIPGYAAQFDLNKLLDSILERWGYCPTSSNKLGKNIEPKVQTLVSMAKQLAKRMLWVVPSLDGECLRQSHCVLSTLVAECGNIWLIAGADHVKSELAIDSRYSFVSYEVHTRLPYVLETKRYTNAKVKETSLSTTTAAAAAASGFVPLSSLQYVLKCVPQMHVKVFVELAKHGEMPFDSLFEFCRHKLMFAANSRNRLDQLIKEFVDQKVIIRKSNAKGVDMLLVNCSRETIVQVL